MKYFCSNNKKAVTLVEITIVILIMTVFAATIHRIISYARFVSTKTQALGTIRQEALLLLRQLERDIAYSRAYIDPSEPSNIILSIKKGTNSLKMLVPKALNDMDIDLTFFEESTFAKEADNYIEVEYNLQSNSLIRTVDGSNSKSVSSFVKEFNSEIPYDKSHIEIELKMETEVRGFNTTVTHVERVSFAIREATTAQADKRWRQRTKF